jgi:hypothetical protein
MLDFQYLSNAIRYSLFFWKHFIRFSRWGCSVPTSSNQRSVLELWSTLFHNGCEKVKYFANVWCFTLFPGPFLHVIQAKPWVKLLARERQYICTLWTLRSERAEKDAPPPTHMPHASYSIMWGSLQTPWQCSTPRKINSVHFSRERESLQCWKRVSSEAETLTVYK